MSEEEQWLSTMVPSHDVAASSRPLALPCDQVCAVFEPDEVVPADALVRHCDRKQFLPPNFAKPSERSPAEAAFVAARMREVKFMKHCQQLRHSAKSLLERAINKLKAAGIVHRTSRARVRAIAQSAAKETGFEIETRSGGRSRLEAPTLLDLACSPILQRNQLAKEFCMGPRMVTEARCCVASALHTSLTNGLKGIAALFEASPPTIFGVSSIMDETRETLRLPIEAGLPSNLSRTAWGVC